MIQAILSYCSPSLINDCVTDTITILIKHDLIGYPYLVSSIEEISQENEKLSLAIGTVRSSKFALILEEADNRRDRLLMGLTQVTKACILREEKLISASASEVYRVIKAHGLSLKRESYQSESAGIDSLANELSSDKMKGIINSLSESKAFLQELISANNLFKSHFDENMTHKAEIEKLNSPSIQKKLVRQLFNNKVVRFINMMSEIDPITFTPIAKQIAPYTEKINLTAKAGKSRKENEPEDN